MIIAIAMTVAAVVVTRVSGSDERERDFNDNGARIKVWMCGQCERVENDGVPWCSKCGSPRPVKR